MTTIGDHRITPQHRERTAIVYVRQSTPEQVRGHAESTRVQLGLRERAIALGWRTPIAIDDDLGISASGFADRPGFQRMLAEVALRHVGIILCIDASRLSRNSRDFAHLFELCGFFETLVADLDQVYDLRTPNDRLVLGIKGTVAEMELCVLRTRLKMGAESKASRGELKFIVPPGYGHDHAGRIVLDPDERIREAVRAMFDRFDQCTSSRQLALLYRDTKTLFPVRKVHKSRTVAWEIPTHSTLRKLLLHPIYAGLYVYGRRTKKVEYSDGRLVKRAGPTLPLDKCRVRIQDHHDAYISWDRFQANQAKIADARPRWRMDQNRGAIRDGLALLAGVLRCRHCGRKLYVAYKASSALYFCDGGQAKGSRRCLSFGSKLIDARVGEELCRALEPLALEASKAASQRRDREHSLILAEARLRVQAATYEADRAFEQFDQVDPKNRLVADTLERRLNDRLGELSAARQHLEQTAAGLKPLSAEQHAQLAHLANDFSRVWDHCETPITAKKRLLRAAICEVIVAHPPAEARIEVVIHWQGGAHTRIEIDKRATPIGSRADGSLVDLVRRLAQSLDDANIARILNMKKTTTPRGLPWTQDRVTEFRKHQHIVLPAPAHDPDLLTGQQAADHLGISRSGLIALIREGIVDKQQVTDFAPWSISKRQLDSAEVQRAVRSLKATGRVTAQGGCLDGQRSLFPGNSSKED
jgi:DNA invertase Pin-like site-specific DNA recombinase